jgi:putative hydrolase of the HAD superfamily
MVETKLREGAAVFDFDGTLVDSFTSRRDTHKKVSVFLLVHLKRRSDGADLKRMMDIISRIDIEMHQNRIYDRNVWWVKTLKRYTGQPIDLPESTITEASTLYWESTKKKSRVYLGVRNMLRTLKHEGIKLGLISDTDGLKGMKKERIEASGLANMFDAIVIAGEDTVNVKPDPGAFTLMINRLDVSSRNCVSIGDNPATDVDGALRTGMKVIIIRNKLAPQAGSSKRYHLVDRKRLTKFIIDTLRATDNSGGT